MKVVFAIDSFKGSLSSLAAGEAAAAGARDVFPDAEVVNDHGIDAFFPVLRTVCTLGEALDVRNAAANLRATSRQAFRLWATAHGR